MPISPRQAADLVEMWAAPLKNGKAPSYKELAAKAAKKFKERGDEPHTFSQSSIERAVKHAFRDGYVELKRNPIQTNYRINEDYRRNDELERQLVHFWSPYHNISTFVIEPLTGTSSSSDQIHEMLGAAFAQIFTKYYINTHFHNSCRIGVGSGRAVFFATKSLSELGPKNISDVTIMSLTGDMSHELQYGSPSDLSDANNNLQNLLNFFSNSVYVKKLLGNISHQDISTHRRGTILEIYPELYDKAGKSILNLNLSDDSRLPTFSILGLGALHHDHRAWNYLHITSRVKHNFGFIQNAMKEICNIVDDFYDSYGEVAVCDMCNRYFVVDLPRYVENFRENDRKKIKKLSYLVNSQVNKYLLTMPKTGLHYVKNGSAIICGTKKKALGLKTIIEQNLVNVSMIFIDKSLAEKLIHEYEGNR